MPNASFIGFTGTPVDSKDADTVELFGEIIHTYDIRQATADKAVVPIIYEPRLAHLLLGNPKLEEEAEEIAADLAESERNRILWAATEDAAGSIGREEAIALDILDHYQQRSSRLPGKAMAVCMSRRNCVKLYDAITAIPGHPEVAVIMTGNIAKDPVAWNPHLRTQEAIEAIKTRFRDPDDKLKIVIVRDMWLTGFDNPALHTLYVDKVMSGHNLIQAVNRVATVFRDKSSGLIVDFIGIGDNLSEATKKYTKTGGTGTIADNWQEVLPMVEELITEMRKQLPAGFSYTNWLRLEREDKFKLVHLAINYLVKNDEVSNRFLLNEKKLSSLYPVIKGKPEVQDLALDIIFFQHVGAALRKAKFPKVNIKKKEGQIKELIHRSIESAEVVDVFKMAGIERFDISIISDEFLATAKERKTGTELQLELIRQIINNEIKLRSNRNLIKYRKLKEEVEKIIHDYHKNFFTSLEVMQQLREVARQIQDEDQRMQQLGLTDEEEAFYEILAKHQTALQDFDLIKEIVKEVTATIKKNLSIDWHKKGDIKAQIQLSVKRILLRKGVHAELQDILAEIMEQAEARYKEWEFEAA